MTNTETQPTADTEQATATTDAAAASATAAAAKQRSRWSFNEETNVATLFDPISNASKSFDMAALPNVSARRMAVIGFTTVIGRAADMDAAYAALVKGEITVRKPAAPKEPNNWRKAIAAALVEVSKKAGDAKTIEEATAIAVNLTPKQVKLYQTDAAVVKHYNKLEAPAAGLSALLAA